MESQRHPIDHPAAWKASELTGKDAVSVDLSDRHLQAFDQALREVQRRQLTLYEIEQSSFDLAEIEDDVSTWRDQVMQGRGLIVLRRIPVWKYQQAELEMIFWGLGAHFGTAMSQSMMGDRLGHVIDVGGKDPRERAYRNSRELALHTDACDVVTMFCLRQAMRGGISGFSSGSAIYNKILSLRPELLDPLFDGYYYHRFGEEQPGESPVTPHKVPVFSECEGCFSVHYLRAYIDLAYQELGTELGAQELEALDLFDQVADSEDIRLDFMLEPGDAVFFNNQTMLHTRTAFEDDADPEKKRHMFRLWLVAHQRRPVVDTLRMYDGDGIAEQKGRSTYFAGDLNYKEFTRSGQSSPD